MPQKTIGLTSEEAASKFGTQLASSVGRLKIFNWIVIGFTRITSSIGLSAAVVLLLFIVHQLFLWVDREPEKAFERAALLLEIVEVVWDTLGVLVNSGIDVSNAALIPIWNAYTFYVVEPVVVLILEVFSVIFFSHHYEGVIDEVSFPYQGLDCTSSAQAMVWCGRYHAYEKALINDESGFVNNSQIFLGLRTARRLSEISGTEQFATPQFEIDGLTESLTEVATLSIVAAAPLADVAAAILDDVLVTSASVVFDAVFLVLKSLLETFKMLTKSGLLTFFVGVGVDFLVIYYLYYQLPLFFAGMDFIMCMVDFFFPSGWGEQLRCADTHCFTGPSAMTDLLIFTSVPAVLKQFGTILEVTLNSNTGRRFAGNFAYDAGGDIASLLQSFYPSAALSDCTSCFKCRLRLKNEHAQIRRRPLTLVSRLSGSLRCASSGGWSPLFFQSPARPISTCTAATLLSTAWVMQKSVLAIHVVTRPPPRSQIMVRSTSKPAVRALSTGM